jgi:hypothetical protein
VNRNGIDAAGPAARTAAARADYDHVGRRLRTLEQCALYKRTLRLTCPRCGHVRVLDAVCLWWMFNRQPSQPAYAAPAAVSRKQRRDRA